MDWLAFLGSILGGLIGGIFTFLGVKMTINHENLKSLDKKHDEKVKNKPRLEIIGKTEFTEYNEKNFEITDLDCIILPIKKYKSVCSRINFYYDETSLDKNNLCYKEYVFKNTGLTEIDYICVTTNVYQTTALFELSNYDAFINCHALNYDACSNKYFIKPGETIKMRFYYLKDQIILSPMGNATITIWLKDINGSFWSQPLFLDRDNIDKSYENDYKDFRDAIDVRTAIECFKNPYLW